MTHDEAQELIAGLVLDELDGAERAAVLAHLAGCATCQDTVDAMRQTLGLVRDALADGSAPTLAPERLAALIAADPPVAPGDDETAPPRPKVIAATLASLAAAAEPKTPKAKPTKPAKTGGKPQRLVVRLVR